MNEYKLITQRIGLIGITNLIVSFSGLILLPILTKNLSIEEYGMWVQIVVTIGFFVPLATLGLRGASSRFLAGEKDVKVVRKGFYSIFAVVSVTSFILFILIFVFSKPIAIALFGGTEAEYFVRLFSPLIFLGGMNAVLTEYFVTFQKIKKYSSLSLLETALQIMLISYFLLAGFGLFGAVISLLILNVLMLILKFLLIVPQLKITFPSYSLVRKYLTFSTPLIPAILCYWIYTVSDRYVVGFFLGMASVGVYSASYNLGGIVSLFYGPISVVLLPTLSQLYEAHKIEEIKTHLKYLMKFYLMLAIPTAFGLTVLSKPLLVTFTTSEFISGFIIIPIIALATIFFNFGSITGNVLILYKKTRTFGLITIMSALINLILNIILVPLIGISGAAIATLITFAFYMAANTKLSFKELSYEIDFKFISKSIVASIPMALFIWKLNPYGAVSILIALGIATGVYFGVLIVLKGFTGEEYRFLKTFIKIKE